MDKRRLIVIVVCSFAAAYLLQFASRQLRFSARIDANTTKPADTVSSASRALRPNYPYSVIPGGVYTPGELGSAMRRDKLVNEHYSDFDWKSARLVSLTEDRLQYVSYRLHNRVYWTRNKLRIPKGEVLLTDGYRFARTRCGNRLSSRPKPEIAAEQPSTRLLALPTFTPALLRKGEVTLAPPPAEEVVTEARDLPFDLPRLAPYLPGAEMGSSPIDHQTWPTLQTYPPGSGVIASGTPTELPYQPARPISPNAPSSSPNTPPAITPLAPGPPDVPELPGVPTAASPQLPVAPILPVVPVTPGSQAPPVNEVPEPATLSLLAISLAGSIWLLTRVIRKHAG